MKYKLIIALLLIGIGARSQTAWTNVGNGLQQRVVAGKTEYRFTKITPYSPYALTDSLTKNYISNNKTNTPEAKRISVFDSIKTNSVVTFSESNLYGTTDRTVNYERLRNYFSNNIFNINTENAGSGVKRIISIGIGGTPSLPTSDASQSYTLFNTNPAIVGAASGYGVTSVKVGLNQPGIIGNQVFTKSSLTSAVTGQGMIGGGFTTFLGASNTFNWTTLANQHPNIQGLSSVVGQSAGATGSLPKVAAMFGTITGGGATIAEANLLNLTYGHVGTIVNAVGARITDVNAGTNNTFLLMNLGDATAPPTGNYGIYGDYSYNNYLGTGSTMIGSPTNNGGELQVFHAATDALPGLVIDGNQSIGGKHISLKNIGVEYGYIDNNGRLFGSGISNYGSLNNSSFNTTLAGAIATRNVADAGKAFVARQINSGSTGDIFDAQFINPVGSKFKIDYRGVIGINGTLLAPLQSFRTSASGTASEAFTAADDANTVHKTGVESISGTKTFSSSVVVNSSLNATTLAVSGVSNLAGGATSSVTPVGASDLINKAYMDAALALKPNLASSNTYTAGTNTFPNAGIIVGSNTGIGYSILNNNSIGVQDITNNKSAGINGNGFAISNSTGTVNILQGSLTTTRNVTYGDVSGTIVVSSDGSATLDFPSTAASSSSELTITVTGAVLGDNVVCTPPVGAVMTNTVYSCWVSATNTVTVRFSNLNTLTASDPPSSTFKAKVIR